MKRFSTLFLFMVLAFVCRAQISLTASSGTATGSYTTLKGAFDAINAGTHTGSITISVTANTTETASAILNASGSGTASYTAVVVRPATGTSPTITGEISSAAVVRIQGSNVTIDGSNTVGGTTRNLTISNSSTTSPTIVSVSSTAAAPVTNVTIRNSTLINGSTTSSGVVAADLSTATTAGGYFTNLTIQNNSIQKAYIGTFIFAATATGNGNGTLVTGNNLDATGTNAIRLVGIYLQGVDGATVTGNTIGNFETVNTEIDRGIWLATATVNTTVSGNTISGLGYSGTSTGSAMGISLSSGNANANLTVRGNTISGLTSSGTAVIYGIYLFGSAAVGNVVIDKNKISTISNTNTGGYGAAGIVLSSVSTAANTLVSNNFVADIKGYGYATTAGINDNGNGIVVTSGAGYNIYHNSVSLSTNQNIAGQPAAINITSGVTAAGAVNLVNNIFSNTQTTTGARYAIYSGAANTVFGTINYNDYYTTGAALGYIGSDRATLADIQTGFGGNANSKNILPTFASTTDLHLSGTVNNGFNNAATPLPSVTTDIDNQTRSTTTPDLGADEFDPALPVTLLTFRAQKMNGFNRLTWVTSSENNNAGFEIQRSASGNDFVTISKQSSLAPNGNSNTELTYTADDKTPLKQVAYYRLKQSDKDGRSMLSQVVVIKGDDRASIQLSVVYPNPVKESVGLNLISDIQQNITLSVTSLSGQKMFATVKSLTDGINKVSLDVSRLAAGSYILQVQVGSLSKPIVTTFIKQ